MKSTQTLKNISYKDSNRTCFCGHSERLPATALLAGVNLVNLLFAASWHNYTL